MKHVAPVILVALFTAACAAGEPQNDAVRNDARMHLLPATDLPADTRQTMNDGIHELDMNHSAEAYQHFQRVIATDSTSAIAEAYAAAAGAGIMSTQTVTKVIQRAVELAPHGTPLEQAVINTYDRLWHNDNAGALQYANKFVSLAPENPRSWMMLASVDSTLGNTPKAREDLQKALSLAPDFAPIYIELAATYSGSAPFDLPKAEQYARKAVELEPDESLSYDALGDALRQQGKLDEAAQAYTKQAALDPTNGEGLQQRAHVNSFLGHYAEARADYDAATAVATGFRRALLGSYRPFVAGFEGHPAQQFDELQAMFKSAETVPFEGNAEFQTILSGALLTTAFEEHNSAEMKIAGEDMRDSNAKIASAVGSEDLQRNAKSLVPYTKSYEALMDNDYASAKSYSRQYNAIVAGHDVTSIRYGHELAGDIALQQKQYAEAVTEYEQANPNDPFVWYCHAEALEGAGRVDDAQTLYRAISNYYFNAPGVSLIRARVLAKLKKTA